MYRLQSVGADPEGFALHPEAQYVPAVVFMADGKGEAPVHADCCCVEMVVPYAMNRTDFVTNVLTMRDEVRAMLDGYGMTPVWKTTAPMNPEFLGDHRTNQAGCDPDTNVYTGTASRPRDFPGSDRYAGGHVHVGYEGSKDSDGLKNVTKAFEILHGTVGALLDEDTKRRQMYGAAGAVRPKEYGVEIRSPSNWWVTSVSRIEFTYECVRKAVEEWHTLVDKVSDAVIQDVLNNRNLREARNIINALKLEVVQ